MNTDPKSESDNYILSTSPDIKDIYSYTPIHIDVKSYTWAEFLKVYDYKTEGHICTRHRPFNIVNGFYVVYNSPPKELLGRYDTENIKFYLIPIEYIKQLKMEKDNKIFRFYSKPDKYPQRIALAGEYKDGFLRVSATRCSPEDTYIKSTARNKAEGRLKGNLLHSIIPMQECRTEDFLQVADIICDIIDQKKQTVLTNPLIWKSKTEIK